MSQYNDSYYSGGGGGGFLAGGSPFSSTDSPGGVRRGEARYALRPVTICQLQKANQAHTEADWKIDDIDIGQVTIVGQVLSIQAQATNCVYHLDDGTGRIEARHWVDIDSELNPQKWEGIEENKYIRATGTLKSFGNKRYINTMTLRAVPDPHEVYFHQLESMTVTLTLERGPPSGTVQPKGKDVAMSDASAYSAPSTSVAQPNQYSHLPKLTQAIVRFMMEQPSSAEGVHVYAIAKAVGDGTNAEKISAALDTLMDEGLVYTTTDDSHFTLAS